MKTKKLIVAILIFAVILMISVFNSSVEAATTSDLGYLTITKDRVADGVTYKHQLYSENPSDTKNIWNLVTCTADRNNNRYSTRSILFKSRARLYNRKC